MIISTEAGGDSTIISCDRASNRLSSEGWKLRMMNRNDNKDSTQTFMGLRTHLQERVAMPYGTGKQSKNLV
jgi:hypothetical protein